jgi:hypothetical protein
MKSRREPAIGLYAFAFRVAGVFLVLRVSADDPARRQRPRGYLVTVYATRVSYRSASLRIGCIGAATFRGPDRPAYLR